jgi:hypothetical protein
MSGSGKSRFLAALGMTGVGGRNDGEGGRKDGGAGIGGVDDRHSGNVDGITGRGCSAVIRK